VPVALYRPVSPPRRRPLALISHGYGSANTGYSFLSSAFGAPWFRIGGHPASVAWDEIADAFAYGIMQTELQMSDATHAAWFDAVYRNLSFALFQALENPSGTVNGPGASDMTGAQFAQRLQQIGLVRLTTADVEGGVHSVYNPATGKYEIHIEIDDPSTAANWTDGVPYNFNTGVGYVLLHELGHIMTQNWGPESEATTWG
jgi:hypothetical protein